MNRPITLQPATCLGYLPVIKLTDPFHNLLTPPKRIYFPRGYRGCSLVHFPLYAPWTSYFNDIFYLSLAGYIGHRESALSTLFLCRAPKSRAVFPLLPLSNLVIIRSFIFFLTPSNFTTICHSQESSKARSSLESSHHDHLHLQEQLFHRQKTNHRY